MDKLPHIVLSAPPQVRLYTGPGGGKDIVVPRESRLQHGEYLKKRFNKAWDDS